MGEARQQWGRLRGLLAFTWATSRAWSAAAVVCVVASAVTGVASTIATGVLVGSVPAAVRDGWASPAGRSTLTRLGVLVGIFVVAHVVVELLELSAAVLHGRVHNRGRFAAVDAALAPDGIAHLEDAEVLDTFSLLRGAGLQRVAIGQAIEGLVTVAARYLGIIGTILILATFAWWLPILALSGMVVARRASRRHLDATIESMLDTTGAVRRATYYTDLALQPDAAKESRIFGLGSWLGERLTSDLVAALQPGWERRTQSRRRLVLPMAIGMACLGASYVVVGRAAIRGEIDLQALTILTGAVGSTSAVLAFGNADLHLQQGLQLVPALQSLPTIVAGGLLEAPEAERGAPATVAEPTSLPRRSIRFEGVRFRYPGSDRDLYEGLDLDLVAGQSTAIVGLNGAGKTTLIKLLCRLYDPTAGRITADGIDIRAFDPPDWQRRVGAIFQDFTRYELPARDNVVFGADPVRDRERLDRAAERAGATAVVAGLPQGWDTPLSRRFQGGIDPSGGQWQRLALARALSAVDDGAGVLVLDEPTANLDVRAEVELYDRFLELTRGVTTIVVSHRFSTVRRADRIVVLDGGRVVEDGTHDELLAVPGGHYARMFRLQSARFADDGDPALLDDGEVPA